MLVKDDGLKDGRVKYGEGGRSRRGRLLAEWVSGALGRAGLARRRALGGVIEGTPIKPTIRPDDDTGISPPRHH
jgi:hypothetical protein